MNGDLIVGIDVGTTRVKAAVFARDGSIRDYFSGGYETKNPGAGIVEQDAHEWTRLVSKALQSFSRHAKDVAAVGLCSQVNTHVFCDADGQPLAPAIVWQDTRTRDIATKLDARVSHQERMAWWGAPMPIDASHALSRMQWMAQTHPDIWARTGHVLLPKDFCIAHLTGR
ncbi:MAG: FGGY family carbohydrate kinase, partial [Pseudomonadota bacterium]